MRGGRPGLEIQSKLLIMLLAVSIVSVGIVGGVAVLNGRDSLRQAALAQLVSVRELRAEQIERTLRSIQDGVLLDSRTGSVVDASRAFDAAFAQLGSASLTDAERAELDDYYTKNFVPALDKRSGVTNSAERLEPTTPAESYLQLHYTVPPGGDYDKALAVHDAGDGSDWSRVHAQYHPAFQELVNTLGYEDVLMLNTTGDVVYSAYKGVDLGTNVLTGPYAGGALGDAYQTALASNDVDTVVQTDFDRYTPSLGVPTAWVVSPIGTESEYTGAFAVQLPIETINDVMTGSGRWAAQGLGQTGESYLVGPDKTMRSVSRLLLQHPKQFEKRVVDGGTSPAIAKRELQVKGNVLLQPVHTTAVDRALQGHSGTILADDYDGQASLIAYAPLKIAGLNWVIIATMTQDEAFAPVGDFTRNLIIVLVALVIVISALSLLLARLFTRPIAALSTAVRRVAAGETGVEVEARTRDEFGDLAAAFNDMSRSLQVKQDLIDRQREENDRLLLTLMPETVARRYREGEPAIAEDHTDVAVVYAELGGTREWFARSSSVTAVGAMNALVGGFDEAADRLGVERVRTSRDGYLASCGLVVPRVDNVRRAVDFAVEMQQIVDRFNAANGTSLQVRIGVDAGTVSSGLVGRENVAYDLWGDAVDVANAVHATAGEPGVYVSDRVHERLRDTASFTDAGELPDGTPVWRWTGEATGGGHRG